MPDSNITVIGLVYNRSLPFVNRWLHTLAQQNIPPVQVILVDQSNASDYTQVNRRAGEKYGAMHLHLPRASLNMALAFNIGLQLAKTEYVLTTCTDLLYPNNFIGEVSHRASPTKLILAQCGYLPKCKLDYNNWESMTALARENEISYRLSPGACQCVSREWAMKVRGYDERFPAQDGVDDDFIARARRDGLEVEWLQFDDVPILHQWHERSSTKGIGSELYNPEAEVVANPAGWGRLV